MILRNFYYIHSIQLNVQFSICVHIGTISLVRRGDAED
jgi:hypothetical protein